MPPRDPRRPLVYAVVVAVVLGALAGWLARMWTTPSPESRARDTVGELRERAREYTR